jgi:hypothetical protein
MFEQRTIQVISLGDSGRIVKLLSGEKVEEIYTTTVKNGCDRGWRRHLRATTRLSAILGEIIVHIVSNVGSTFTYNINSTSPSLLIIPPNYWFKFEGVDASSVIINMTDTKHDPDEMQRR